MNLLAFAIPALLGYLAGSLPIAFVIARMRGVDLRDAGSRNLGTANVLRTAGLTPAIVVLLGDAAKGAVAVAFAEAMFTDVRAGAIAAIAAVAGHIWPVWLRFRGGKGVATAAGAFAILAPTPTMIAVVAFVVTVIVTRFVSAGSIAASCVLPFVAATTATPATVIGAAVGTAAIIVARHRGNVGRLVNGTERRIGMKA
jgi:glycerol-3-phosphate acyltransferase PlsY